MYDYLINYFTLKVFYCLVYASSFTRYSNRFDPRYIKRIYLGHINGFKCDIFFIYKIKTSLSLETLFNKTYFPTNNSSSSNPNTSNHPTYYDYHLDYLDTTIPNKTNPILTQITTSSPSPTHTTPPCTNTSTNPNIYPLPYTIKSTRISKPPS